MYENINTGMNMKRITIIVYSFLLFFVNTLAVFSAGSNFEKGVTYLLLDDRQQAKLYFTEYFKKNPNPIVRRGFFLLIDKDKKNAKMEFRRFLNMNFRSLQAIVGISLSLSDMKESTTKENLMKAVRLNKSFSSAYACLGMEYLKEKNFPASEKYFLLASKYANLMEYRILLGKLYIEMGQSDKTISLLEQDIIDNPENFFVNYLLARAMFNLNRINGMEKYIRISGELRPNDKDVLLLFANFFLKKGEPKKARDILKNLRYSKPDRDYIKTYGKTLLAIGDRRAKHYLYQFYSIDSWDPEINRLIGKYYFKNRTDKSNLQNWIFRSILTGNSIKSLESEFSSDYFFPKLDSLRFFDLKKIFWADNNRLFVVAKIASGMNEKLFLIDFGKKKILNGFDFDGEINSVHVSKDKDKIILESINLSSKKTKLYALSKNKNGSFQYSSIYTGRNDIPPFDVAFSAAGSEVFFVDRRIKELSFESPFSEVTRFGEKHPVYMGLSGFGIYKYNFRNHRFTSVDEIEEINRINSKTLKKYLMVYNASLITEQVRKLISRGEKLDSFSSEVVRIKFSDNLGSFLIYLSDLKNAFKGIVFDNETGKMIKVNSSMFLEKGRFAELEIVDFDSERKRLVLITRDKRRNLIVFNYKSRLYRKLVENYYDGCFNKKAEHLYILTERNKRFFTTETLLTVFSLNPFWKEELTARRDLKSIINCDDVMSLKVSTNKGEILEMGFDNKFRYVSPSYEGSVHDFSPDKKKVAVFINKRLFLIDNGNTWKRENSRK